MNDFHIDGSDRRKNMDSRKSGRIRRKRRRMLIQIIEKRVIPVLVLLILAVLVYRAVHRSSDTGTIHAAGANAVSAMSVMSTDVSADTIPAMMPASAVSDDMISDNSVSLNSAVSADALSVKEDDQTSAAPGSVVSSHVILISLSDDRIVTERDAHTKMYPASMTKILTVLTAAEHMKSLDDKVTITAGEEDYSYSNDCSNVGFCVGETVPVKDLFYGTVLPSGADAAAALAIYTAGSQEAFVDMMNEECEKLGIADTSHFMNPVGIYDDDHYSTAYDMAVIMNAAVSNDICREVLSAHTYTTSCTAEHPEGITVSNWFLRRIEDHLSGSGTVLCAKTGYVVQSGNCAASYAEDKAGNGYICVTGDSTSSWRCIFDHAALYDKYIK